MSIPGTPKTPRDEGYVSDSQLESLPLEILVKILCHLHHDRDHLKAVFHVSPRIREAVVLARRVHFNYVTPDAFHVTSPPPVQLLPLDSMYMEEREAIARKRMMEGFESLMGWWPGINRSTATRPPN